MPPDNTPITVGDLNQLALAFAIAMFLCAAVVVQWVIGEERKIRAKNKAAAASADQKDQQ